MTPFLFLVSLFYVAPTVFAFEYLVGVGKDENTGKNGIGFDPSSIRPAPGDTITFEFHAGTHSVIQTSFQNPCTPLSGGFNSGDITVPDGTPVDQTGPRQSFQVVDSSPLWFYDGAPNQCGLGGVFSANPALTGDQTAAKYLEASIQAGQSLSVSVSSGSSTASSSGSTPTGSLTGSSSGSTPSRASASSPTSGRSSPSSTSSSTPSPTSTRSNSASSAPLSGLPYFLPVLLGTLCVLPHF